jgi:hypothetical protein
VERYKVNDNSRRMIEGGKTLKVDIDVCRWGSFLPAACGGPLSPLLCRALTLMHSELGGETVQW